ncbi:MAG: hypothetical protein ABSB67_04675 [Bryobacteraceae bacterium]
MGLRDNRYVTAATVLVAVVHVLPLQAAAIIQIRVVEGDGAVYAAGSRATRGLTVQVTDETGQPVDSAAVSFVLPDDGPGGTFASGLRTEIVTTKPDGRATVWGMKWNRTAGPFEVRITAAKGQARAGIKVSQYLSDKVSAGSGGSGEFHTAHSYGRWLLIAAAVGGAAMGGLALSERKASSTPAAANAPGPPSIGTPVIVITGTK